MAITPSASADEKEWNAEQRRYCTQRQLDRGGEGSRSEIRRNYQRRTNEGSRENERAMCTQPHCPRDVRHHQPDEANKTGSRDGRRGKDGCENERSPPGTL